jgi:cellulose synthase/poly-beta-1,6-N-acetylglucosamine synthase-like glycosyltransferase
VSAVLFIVTMAAFVLFFVENYINSQNVLSRFVPGTGAERVVYNLIFAVFMFGSFTYQVSRLSFFLKLRKRVRIAEENLQQFQARGPSAAPSVEIVVPSYREEPHVIWQTLMSAALTDYPHRRIVLLLDNPPNPGDRAERDTLLASRAQVDLVDGMLAPIALRFASVAAEFGDVAKISANVGVAAEAAARLHEQASAWLDDIARGWRTERRRRRRHTREFFVRGILRSQPKPTAGELQSCGALA